MLKKNTVEIINRINQLTEITKPIWGKMSVDQMLAHCCVPYEFVYDKVNKKSNRFKKLMLKLFVKKFVVSEKPYQKNGQTASGFLIKNRREFETEKTRLIHYINKTQELGGDYFEGKESHSFGALTKKEWNTMFYKHLNHHLTQFGV